MSKNPLLIPTEQPEYLETEESSHLLEKTVYKIGRAYAATAAAGGIYGFYEGLRYGEKTSLRLRLNAVLNSIGKRSIKWANGVAVALLFCSCIEVSINLLRDVDDDAYSTLASGFLGAALYKSTAWPSASFGKKMINIGLSGIAGMTIVGAYTGYENRFFREDLKRKINYSGLDAIFDKLKTSEK